MVMHFSEQCLYNVHLALPTTCCCFREEKDYSKWARDRLKELLLEMECPVFSTGELKISDVVTAEGDVSRNTSIFVPPSYCFTLSLPLSRK